MRKGIGIGLIFVGLIFIAAGAYFGILQYTWDEWTKFDNEEDVNNKGNEENNKQKEVEDSVIIKAKKKEYLQSANSFIDATILKVNDADEDISFFDNSLVYYIPVSNNRSKSCVDVEKGGSSPFGEWDYAYVIVTLNESVTSYSYSFMGLDKAGYGMNVSQVGDDNWTVDNIKKGIVPLVPKSGDIVNKDILPYEKRTNLKAVVFTVVNGKCIMPDI
jgi:hypothetical protein